MRPDEVVLDGRGQSLLQPLAELVPDLTRVRGVDDLLRLTGDEPGAVAQVVVSRPSGRGKPSFSV